MRHARWLLFLPPTWPGFLYGLWQRRRSLLLTYRWVPGVALTCVAGLVGGLLTYGGLGRARLPITPHVSGNTVAPVATQLAPIIAQSGDDATSVIPGSSIPQYPRGTAVAISLDGSSPSTLLLNNHITAAQEVDDAPRH